VGGIALMISDAALSDLKDRKLSRPVLRWHGGKWRLAPWIISHFPPHRIYVEPFGGAASVLLRKERSYAEVYNDLDDLVVNLFRVLRHPEWGGALLEALRLTPFSRIEFEQAMEPGEDDPVETARRLIVRSFMGFGSNAHSASPHVRSGFRAIVRGVNHGDARTGLRFQGRAGPKPRAGPGNYRSTGFRSNSNRSGTTPAHDWANYPPALAQIIDRLEGVVIEHRDACEVMAQHDSDRTLMYVDPPYLPETRSPANKYDLKHRAYRHELTADDHKALLDFLCGVGGMVVLSGYPAPLYDERLPGWRRIETSAHADGARPRTEVVWLNPACAAALDRHACGAGSPLFSGALA
jgi:DNA adenine methylase